MFVGSVNNVTLEGTFLSGFEYSHSIKEKIFYKATLGVPRNSGVIDKIIIVAPDSMVKEGDALKDTHAIVTGSFRSFSQAGDERTHIILNVLANKIETTDDNVNKNEIEIFGELAKDPVCRQTSSGRPITDLFVITDRGYGTDYIPCIAWNGTAKAAASLKRGSKVRACGRIQSRDFKKFVDKEKTTLSDEIYTAYEVSISNLEAF